MPVFVNENKANRFATEEDAEKWWNNNKVYLTDTLMSGEYDINTIAIRKTIYRKKKDLKV